MFELRGGYCTLAFSGGHDRQLFTVVGGRTLSLMYAVRLDGGALLQGQGFGKLRWPREASWTEARYTGEGSWLRLQSRLKRKDMEDSTLSCLAAA